MARFSILSIVSILFLITASWSAGSSLDQAWEEYRYKNFGMAEKAFKDVSVAKDASTRDIAVAKLGLALVYTFQSPGANPEKAIEQLKALAKELRAEDSLNAAVHLFLGRAYMTLSPKDVDNAGKEFSWVIDKFPLSFQASEAIIELSTIPLWVPTRDNIEKTISAFETAIAQRPADAFLVNMHQYAGRFSLMLKQWQRGRDHMIKAVELGLPNQRDLGTYCFAIAYVSDHYLKDPATAVTYYQRLIDNVISDTRRYYCQLRIDELSKEIKK